MENYIKNDEICGDSNGRKYVVDDICCKVGGIVVLNIMEFWIYKKEIFF